MATIHHRYRRTDSMCRTPLLRSVANSKSTTEVHNKLWNKQQVLQQVGQLVTQQVHDIFTASFTTISKSYRKSHNLLYNKSTSNRTNGVRQHAAAVRSGLQYAHRAVCGAVVSSRCCVWWYAAAAVACVFVIQPSWVRSTQRHVLTAVFCLVCDRSESRPLEKICVTTAPMPCCFDVACTSTLRSDTARCHISTIHILC